MSRCLDQTWQPCRWAPMHLECASSAFMRDIPFKSTQVTCHNAACLPCIILCGQAGPPLMKMGCRTWKGKMLVVGCLPSKTSRVCSSNSSIAACPAPLAACNESTHSHYIQGLQSLSTCQHMARSPRVKHMICHVGFMLAAGLQRVSVIARWQ